MVVFGAKDQIKGYIEKTFKPSKEDIKSSLRDVIIEDPQFFINAFRQAEVKEMEKAQQKSRERIKEYKDEIEKSGLLPFVGQENSNITLVYFFDYKCGACKKSNSVLHNLLKKYPNIKILYKELPILGPDSRDLARSALAIYLIEPIKYPSFHDALMTEQNVTNEAIKKILKTLDIKESDYENALKNPKIDESIDKINELASKIGLRGTPALIINNDLVTGANEEQLSKIIEQLILQSDASAGEVKNTNK